MSKVNSLLRNLKKSLEMATLPRQMKLRLKKSKVSLQRLKLRVKINRKLLMKLSRNFKTLQMRLRQGSKRPRLRRIRSLRLNIKSLNRKKRL